jgi:hypothetical protein
MSVAVREVSPTPESSRSEYKRNWRHKKKEAKREAARAGLTAQQAEAAGLADLIRSHSSQFPTLKIEINDFLAMLHKRSHQSPDVVGAGVWKALEWPGSLEDICEATGFAEWAVLQVLEGMRSLGTAEEVECGYKAEETDGPKGCRAKRTLWRRTGKAPRTLHVLP